MRWPPQARTNPPENRLVDVDHPVSNLIEVDGFVIASATDLGRKRSGNEDSHALWVPEDAETRMARGLLCVVCDGMGGASAGEVASQMSVATVVEIVRSSRASGPDEALRDAIEQANTRVHAQASANPDQRGMGTTCTAMIVRGSEVWVGHVGDSRAYLVRGGKARPLTRDHSLVAELVEKGHLSAEEAKTDHRRNVVTRSVGALEYVEVDAELAFDGLQMGDVLVLCSDGLHGLVTDAEIAHLAGESAPAEACAGLIDLANERGGPDNITVFVVRRGSGGTAATVQPGGATGKLAPSRSEPGGAAGPKAPPSLGALGWFAGVMVVLVLIVGAVLFGLLKRPAEPVASGDPGRTAAAPGDAGAAAPEPAAAPVSGADAGANTRDAEPVPAAQTPGSERPPVPVNDVPPAPVASAPARAAGSPAAPNTTAPEPVAGRPGSVRLTTRPFQPCTFIIDGEIDVQDVGFLTKKLPPGDHVVRVEGSAGGAVDVPVRVESGGSYSLVAELPYEGTLGSIDVVLTGSGKAQVFVDGAQYPEDAPCVVRGLTPGPHTLRVRRSKGALLDGPGEVVVAPGASARAEYRSSAVR